MWIPVSADEIEARVADRSLDENAYFDAKRDLGGKNKDIAKDVTAMANNGGVLVYGIGEDEHNRPTILAPIVLRGQRERIDAVVHTSVAPPPEIRIDEHPLASDPELGYLVVAVPASPQAPHMVMADKDNRYYQRMETQSVPMPEGEVSRLYERRQRWEVDREQLLSQAVERNQRIWPPDPNFADLHVVVRPVAATPSMIDEMVPDADPQIFLLNLLVQARHVFSSSSYHPDLTPQGGWYPRDGGWRAGSHPQERSRQNIVDLTVTERGIGYFFCGCAGDHLREGDPYLLLLEDLVAGLTTRTLFILGSLYKAARYLGPVDVGVAVTGLSGYPLYSAHPEYRNLVGQPLPRTEDYRRTARVLAHELEANPRRISRSLVLPLIHQVTSGAYDPY
jgi:hypothetical protein